MPVTILGVTYTADHKWHKNSLSPWLLQSTGKTNNKHSKSFNYSAIESNESYGNKAEKGGNK